jgi:hypothetical protein
MWILLVIVAWIIYFVLTREGKDGESLITWKRFDDTDSEEME